MAASGTEAIILMRVQMSDPKRGKVAPPYPNVSRTICVLQSV